MSACLLSWIDILSAALAPLIAIFGLIFTRHQLVINQRRLKHELFDRRYAQFEAVRNFIGTIIIKGQCTQEMQREYLLGTKGMRFLFDEAFAKRMDASVWEAGLELERLNAELDGLPCGTDRGEKVSQLFAVKRKLNDQLTSLEEDFSYFLQLGH